MVTDPGGRTACLTWILPTPIICMIMSGLWGQGPGLSNLLLDFRDWKWAWNKGVPQYICTGVDLAFFHSFSSSYSFLSECLPAYPVTNFTIWLWADYLTAQSFHLHTHKMKIRTSLSSLSGIKIISCYLIPSFWWLPTMIPKYISSDEGTNTDALRFLLYNWST